MRLVIKYPVEKFYIYSAYILEKGGLNGKECFQSHIMPTVSKRIKGRDENIIQFKYQGTPYSVPAEWLEDLRQGEFVITDNIIKQLQ